MDENIIMDGVREYYEGYEVVLSEKNSRPIIVALNECGYNSTAVDLLDLVLWIKTNMPELLKDN